MDPLIHARECFSAAFTADMPDSLKPGLTVEFILLSVAVISTKESAGQFDDSAAGIVRRGLLEYHGVKEVITGVLYKHTKIEQHVNGCQCHYCTFEHLDPGMTPTLTPDKTSHDVTPS